MRRHFVAILALLVNVFVLSAADATGTWKGTATLENQEPHPAVVILKQGGDAVTGTVGPDEGERIEIANGKVTGDKITFEVMREGQSIKFVLMLDGDKLSGQVIRERQGGQQMGKLTLKREK